MINKLFNGKPILVTGSHRSGSTWVGRMLSLPSKVRYIQEPFNLNEPYKNKPLTYWFEYVSNADDSQRQQAFYTYINNFIGIPINMLSSQLVSAVLSGTLKSHLGKIKERLTRRYLIKDPLALFSAEWMAQKFDMEVVVVIRHPAAFVASLKKQLWYHDFSHFTDQRLLMSEVLSNFKTEIKRIEQAEADIIEHGILLWNLIHYRIKSYQDDQNGWHFVRHEDLSSDPIVAFKKLYKTLRMDFSADVETAILNHTQGNLKSDLRRNSSENIQAWKRSLTAEEILRIRTGTWDISTFFYSEKEW
ncbi:MAG: sulfotransferase [Saprospiraceae bacterium]|nr:sulfotransferase [Saprospiraceae bacterium]